MEFLTTPDLGHGARWAATPGGSVFHGNTPRAPPSAPDSSVIHGNSTPNIPTSSTSTPQVTTPSFYAPVDRAGIKNSFQSLFSPAVANTPAMLARHPSTAPGLTPFINGMPTPSLVPPGSNVLPSYTPVVSAQLDHHSLASPSPNAVLSSPYLQAAAKEAVRREFMNMPSYITPGGGSTSGERVVPSRNEADTPMKTMHEVAISSPATALTPSESATHQVSPSSSADAKVPTTASPTTPSSNNPQESKHGAPGHGMSTASGPDKHRPQHAQQGIAPQMQPYFMPPHPQHHGMVMIGQHGQMMMAAPPGAMYGHPGMMMFPGGQGGHFPQGMMMHGPNGGQMQRPQTQQVKPETQAERKERIEHEKQELIREFKKKTREAALVRFRQKRRERRFGKLIRYDCRKKLADARPRVKGRFVRIKEDDDSDAAQVVPDLSR